jgi:hypothetical protein
MPFDLFDQLAQQEVPPPPSEFERGVHERLNKRLLWTHLIDLATGGLAHAVGHFAQAWLHLVMTTFAPGRAPGARSEKDQGDGTANEPS